LNAAVYGLADAYRSKGDMATWKKWDVEFNNLKKTEVWFDPGRIRYTEMGHYAEVIGRPANPVPPPTGPVPLFTPHENFRVNLAAGARWARAAHRGSGPSG